MQINEKILQLRKQAGWSQEELGRRIGANKTHISRLEKGRYMPSVRVLKALADVFEVTTDFLIDDNLDEFDPHGSLPERLAERVKQLEALVPEERKAVETLIEALSKKRRVMTLIMEEAAS